MNELIKEFSDREVILSLNTSHGFFKNSIQIFLSLILIFLVLYQHQRYLICSDDSFNVLQKEEINKMLKQI